MNRKQKKVLTRIIIAFVLLVLLRFLPVDGYLRMALYMIPYLVIGYDILKKAFKGIRNRQVFDENFLMAVATIGAIALGDYQEGTAVMLFYHPAVEEGEEQAFLFSCEGTFGVIGIDHGPGALQHQDSGVGHRISAARRRTAGQQHKQAGKEQSKARFHKIPPVVFFTSIAEAVKKFLKTMTIPADRRYIDLDKRKNPVQMNRV